jgi:hypothetical protein
LPTTFALGDRKPEGPFWAIDAARDQTKTQTLLCMFRSFEGLASVPMGWRGASSNTDKSAVDVLGEASSEESSRGEPESH